MLEGLQGLLNPKTIKGIIVLFLIIWFGSGTGFRVINNLIKNYVK